MAYALLDRNYSDLRESEPGAQNSSKAYELRDADKRSNVEATFLISFWHTMRDGNMLRIIVDDEKSVWESEVCAQSAGTEQKYATIASSMNWLKHAAPEGRARPSLRRRPAGADRPWPSRLGIFVVGIISPERSLRVPEKTARAEAVDRLPMASPI